MMYSYDRRTATRKPLKVFENKDDGIEARIFQNTDGKSFNVVLYDVDSEQSLDTVHIFPSMPKAEEHAKRLVR